MPDPDGNVTRVLSELCHGNQQAAEQLLPLVYKELRSVAMRYLRKERANHTLQATELVHEAYLKLIRESDRTWQNRAHFIGVAANAMRAILVDYARAWQAGKRKSNQNKVPLIEEIVCSPERSRDLIALDDALRVLAEKSPRQAKVVELRYFGGLNVEDTAEVLGVSPKTVKRDWSLARTWLFSEVRKR